jgi:hypothetical protein
MNVLSDNRRGGPLLAAALAALLASSPFVAAADVPQAPAPPAGNIETARWYAAGSQIYVSKRRADDPARFEWTLKAPAATLYNGGGNVVGTHYGGPTWESNNGSKVIGLRLKSVDSPDPDAIPWLLLQGVRHEGHGMFSAVTYIQRIDTQGGKAPAEAPTAEGLETSVPYSATYVFYEAAAE